MQTFKRANKGRGSGPIKTMALTMVVASVLILSAGQANAQDQEGPDAYQILGALVQLNAEMNAQRRQQMRDQELSNVGGQLPLAHPPRGMDNYAEEMLKLQQLNDD